MSILIGAVLLGLIPAFIAHQKGHSFWTWWLGGSLLFILALPMAIMEKPSASKFQICPHCQTVIPKLATVCPRCTRDIVRAA
jgi:ribosomal protein L40E